MQLDWALGTVEHTQIRSYAVAAAADVTLIPPRLANALVSYLFIS